MLELLPDAIAGEKYAIARIISEIEKENSLPFRKELFSKLEEQYPDRKSITIGITGTPGAGKSSLLGELTREFLNLFSKEKLAMLAIDPTSHVTGGSILGDRTRVIVPRRENRVFFRSQASQLELGGLNPFTYHVLRFLRYLYDFVIIETVGIGQNEIEISKITDSNLLVLQPLGGDQVQFMQSGIMEIPNDFILNKCDEEPAASRAYAQLLSTLEFIHSVNLAKDVPPIFKTSALKQIGIVELWEYFRTIHPSDKSKESILQFEKWVKEEYGKTGLKKLKLFPNFYEGLHSFEEFELRFR